MMHAPELLNAHFHEMQADFAACCVLYADDAVMEYPYGAERSRTRTAESAAIRVDADRDDAERLALMLPDEEVPFVPTHRSFGQLTTMVGVPFTYLRKVPAPLAAINLQYGLTSHRAELIKTLEIEDGRIELRAVTGPDYVRIYDHEPMPLKNASLSIAPVCRHCRRAKTTSDAWSDLLLS